MHHIGGTAYNKKIMASIARLAGEGIGPFKSFDFDFSDEQGNPHPGPHIFAGINGSGKSTVLKTIAWSFESSLSEGFQWQEWQHLIQGYGCARAMIVLDVAGFGFCVLAHTMDTNQGWEERLFVWVKALLATGKVESLKGDLPIRHRLELKPMDSEQSDFFPATARDRKPWGLLRLGGPEHLFLSEKILIAGYGPSRLLRHLPEINLSVHLEDPRDNALSFEATVQNEAVQSWLLGLFSKRAIAKERRERTSKYSAALGRFEDALRRMCGQDVEFDVDIEPSLQPKLLMYHKRLDFSQLPDGVRSTVGWLADFLMRMDSHDRQSREERASVLLLDEVDAHLHPKWQRSILPSIKQALPEVQVFATSHSPFVIASCFGARVHVLELDEAGRASNRPAEDAPIGESILATMKDIFGVNSRFDVETEKLLDEWNQLRRSQAAGDRHPLLAERLAGLTQELSSRSEELRQVVAPAVALSDSLIASLQSKIEPTSERPSKTKASK
jgi:hypothetical protein